MKLKILFVIFILISNVSFSDEFPISKDITYGKLSNGLTYYIRPNSKPENKAQIRLFVKAGSIHERDDQKGLAHLIEHMAFQGSKNFPKNKIDEYFNSMGLTIGADFNAHTSYDETVYKFTVPSEKQNLDTGIHILSDIAGRLDLKPDAFERERKIVEEEWRVYLGKNKRLEKQIEKVFFKNSIYEKRDVIGDIDVIRNFKYQTAIDYYNTNYRTDRMAVIAVGDFDAVYIKDLIEKYFLSLPKPEIPFVSPNEEVPDYQGTQFALITDKEQERTIFGLYGKHPRIVTKTRAQYKKYLKERIIQKLFYKRFNTFDTNEYFSPTISASNLDSKNDLYSLRAILNEREIKKGIQLFLKEIENIYRYGFTDDEIRIGKKEVLTDYLQSLKYEPTRKSSSFIGELQRHFTEGEMISGIEFEYNLAKILIADISKNDLDQSFKKFFVKSNRVVEFITGEKNKKNIPTLKEYLKIEKDAANISQTAFKLNLKNKRIINQSLLPGKIVSKKIYPDIKTTEIQLANGVKVFYRYSNYENEQISFIAKSIGGTSHQMDINKLFSAKESANIAIESGLNELKRGQLSYLYPPTFVSVEPYVENYYEGISGSAFKPYTKEMFELIYANFHHMYFYESSFNQYVSAKRQEIQNQNLKPNYTFGKKFMSAYYNNHPRRRIMEVEDLSSIKLKDVESFYKDRFGDASDFIFVITGDFEEKILLNYIKTYLGNLPSLNRNESFVNHDVKVFEKQKIINVKDNSEYQSLGYRFYSDDIEYNIKNRFITYLMTNIIDRLVNERIREEKNLVYYAAFETTDIYKIPQPIIINNFVFQSNPDNIEEIFATFKEIKEDVRRGDFKDQYFKDAVKKEIISFKQDVKTNHFWSRNIIDYKINGDPIDVLNNLDIVIKSITKKDIVQFANKVLDEEYLQAILLPKNEVKPN